jgi:PAS domain S-box-containing protein
MKTTFNPDSSIKTVNLKSLVTIFDYLPGVMFFAKDLEGRFIMANQAFAMRFGYKNSLEILGKNDAHTCSSPEPFLITLKKSRSD